MYKITITGPNTAGAIVTEVLGDDRNKAATVSGFRFAGDDSVFEEIEYIDAKEKVWIPRKLHATPLTFMAHRVFASAVLALNFAFSHRRRVPQQGTVVIEVTGGRATLVNACVRIPLIDPYGARVKTSYEILWGGVS